MWSYFFKFNEIVILQFNNLNNYYKVKLIPNSIKDKILRFHLYQNCKH